MTPRQRALAASSPSLALLLGTLAWNVWDRRNVIGRWLADWT